MRRNVLVGVAVFLLSSSFAYAAEPVEPTTPATGAPAAGIPPSDAPSVEKVKVSQWPGIISIYTPGAGWPADPVEADAKLKAVVDANFGGYYYNLGAYEPIKKAGLKLLVGAWLFEFEKMGPEMRNDPTILGYMMSDRQKPNFFPTWGAWEKMMYEKDPYHPALFTTYEAYGHVADFVNIVKPRAIEFYHYHWSRRGQLYFQTLEIYRNESIRAGRIPVIQYVAVEVDDPRKMRQTTYTSLAYGLRGFKWFVGWLFFDAKKGEDGKWVVKRTPAGEEVAKLNKAIKAYSPIYAKAPSVDVFHVQPLPAWGREAPKDYWAVPSGEEILVGYFQDKELVDYLMISNRDAFKPHEATITFSEKITSVSKMNKETGNWEAVKLTTTGGKQQLKSTIEDGSGELFMVVRSAKKSAFAQPKK